MITLVVRKSCFNDIDYFPDHYSICQDDKLCFELSRKFKFKLVPQELACAIGSYNSMTRNYLNVAYGWSKFFSEYESEILKYCGHRTLAKHQVSVANAMIQAGRWGVGFYLYGSAAYKTFKKGQIYNKFGPLKIPYILFSLLNSSKFRFKYCIKKLLGV
jgi:hypothetical protein